jgi:RND superfamily putative drug exporter
MPWLPSPERLARFSVRRPGLVLGAWGIVIVAMLIAASRIGAVLTSGFDIYVATESKTANTLLEERLYGTLPPQETIVIQSPSLTVDSPDYEAFVREVTAAVRALSGDVVSVTNVYEAGAPGLRSADGRTTLLPVTLTGKVQDAEKHIKPLLATLRTFDGREGFVVVTGGEGSANHAFTEQSQHDLERAEMFGIPIALIILVVVFGALVAAGIPIIIALISILVALGLSALIGQAFELSTFVVNFVMTMGLAVGIDYTLLIIQRFREERANGLSVDDAIVRAGGTASRAVLFSGGAVIVALFGMVIVPQSIFRSLGVGAILVVSATVLAALTLLPAVLHLLGDRVNAVRVRVPFRRKAAVPAGPQGMFWDRSARAVMARPVLSIAVSVGLLVAMAAPYFTIQLGWAGVSTLPQSSEARRAFEILNTEFSAGVLAPAKIVVSADDVTTPGVRAAINGLVARLAQDPSFGPATLETNQAGTLTLISAPMAGDPQGEAAHAAVRHLRESYIPAAFAGSGAEARVTGGTAEGMDNTQLIEDWTIPVFAFVLGLSFVILLVVFRSIIVPVKSIIMNLLSVGASYGLMVLVFQHGIGNEIFGFSQVERIESWVPLFMFAVLFGLSMDYHVFLLTRVRERFNHTHDNTESVAYGVRSTAGIITGAAAIMIAVFGGFASGDMVMFQQMGFGLAVSVFLDASIVRLVLVPATMKLLGERNWYLPSWLAWLPHVDVEGSSVRTPVAVPAGAVGAPAGGSQ